MNQLNQRLGQQGFTREAEGSRPSRVERREAAGRIGAAEKVVRNLEEAVGYVTFERLPGRGGC
jgi:hypothetical protein